MNKILEEVKNGLKTIREKNPLIVNITNYVVMNSTANVLLSIGASPAMAHWPEDVCGLAAISGALVLNPGTPEDEWGVAMIRAGKTANNSNVCVVLDPVGAGATEYRTNINKRILDKVQISVLRGNASEIMSLVDQESGGKGVDSAHSSNVAIDYAKKLCEKYKLVCAVSGESDYITDGNKTAKIDGGVPLLTKVTGTGCALTALTGAFCSVMDDTFNASIASHVIMSICGELAYAKAKAPGSFAVALLDALYEVSESDINKMARVELLS